jgi:hypothetical protein
LHRELECILELEARAPDFVRDDRRRASDLPDGTAGRALAARHSDASGEFSEPSMIATVGRDLSVLGLSWSDRDAAIVVWSESEAGSRHAQLEAVALRHDCGSRPR